MSALERRLEELGALLADPDVIARRGEFMKHSREHAELNDLVAAWQKYRQLLAEVAQSKHMLESESDAELREFAREELKSLEERRGGVEQDLKLLLLLKDPNDG